jgi:hypothetical protein
MSEDKIIAVRFPRLYKATRLLLSEVLDIVRKKPGEPTAWPKAFFQNIEFHPPSSATVSWGERLDIGAVITQVWPEAAAMDSYKAACAELQALQDEGKAVAHNIGDLGAAFLGPLVQRYLTDLEVKFDQSRFQKLYDDLETYLDSEFVKARVFLHLQSLSGDIGVLELDARHSIIRLDENTARHIWSRGAMADVPGRSSFGQGPMIIPVPEQFVLVGTFEFRKTDARRLSLFLHSEATRSSFAFRLAHQGSGPIKVVGYDHIGFFPEYGRFGFREEYLKGRYAYTLNSSVAEQMKRLWADAFETSKELEADATRVPASIRLSIMRYLGSFAEKVAEDRLLDYVIALEASCGRENDAVSYRIPLRVATLIGRDSDERERLFNLVAKAYDKRSKIAHGSAALTEPLDESNENFLLDLQATVLRTIHTYLRAQKDSLNKQDVIRLLDSAIRRQDRAVLESKTRPEFL